jgi:hypothetical protein
MAVAPAALVVVVAPAALVVVVAVVASVAVVAWQSLRSVSSVRLPAHEAVEGHGTPVHPPSHRFPSSEVGILTQGRFVVVAVLDPAQL